MVLSNNKSWLVEIKNAKSIEREAYSNYIDLHNLAYNVGIVILNNGILNFCDIVDLKLKIPAQKNIPVVDQFWLSPRKMPKDKYIQWKQSHPHASGTAFAFIDFENTNFISLN